MHAGIARWSVGASLVIAFLGGTGASAHAQLISPSADAAKLAQALTAQPGLVTGASFPSFGGPANPSSALSPGPDIMNRSPYSFGGATGGFRWIRLGRD